ncbi:transcription factor TCP12-like [Populus alba x Populus x berolinensis]|nr:transcription factor TCP12-like [Populus alba x Populus x berolinensis]
MFSSSSSFNPFQYENPTMIASTLADPENPSSIEDYSPTSFLQHFPDLFLDDDDLLVGELLSQQQQLQQQQPGVFGSNTHDLAVETQEINPVASNDESTRKFNNSKMKGNVNTSKQPIRQRRTGKKDRHSKIHTAQGPRDRRMRLSLQIARKFFDLQDMLGFDKASKTIEWLFTKSKAAIKELTDTVPKVRKCSSTSAGKSVSSTSESEVVSGIKLTPDINGDRRVMEAKSDSLVSKHKEKRSKKVHKPVFNPVDRESREKARARARDRTREKMKNKGINKSSQSSQANPDNLEKFGYSSTLEYGENLASGRQEINSSVKVVDEEEESNNHHHLLPHQMDNVSIIDKFFGITNSPRSSSIFGFSESVEVPSGATLKDEFSGFPLKWDVTNGRVQYKYNALPNMKLPSGNVQAQNPNANFMTTPHALEQNLSTMIMTTLNAHVEESPNSAFMNMPNPNEQNPISILKTTTTIDNGNQFSSSHIFARDYDRLY